jgi:hypothetical protein
MASTSEKSQAQLILEESEVRSNESCAKMDLCDLSDGGVLWKASLVRAQGEGHINSCAATKDLRAMFTLGFQGLVVTCFFLSHVPIRIMADLPFLRDPCARSKHGIVGY